MVCGVTGKELVAAFAQRLEGRDWGGLTELLHPDVVYEIPRPASASEVATAT